MAITINNTSINTRLSILFDAGINPSNENDGPAYGTGNTESDVYIDNKVYTNLRSHTEVPSDVHALQCWNKSGTWSYELEYTDNRENLTYEQQSDLPSWVTNVVIRCEAQDVWQNAYEANVTAQGTAWIDAGNAREDFVANASMATSHADTERNTYLSGNNITY